MPSPDSPQPLPVYLTDSDLTREGRCYGRYVSGPDPLLLLGHPGPLTKGKGREFFFKKKTKQNYEMIAQEY